MKVVAMKLPLAALPRDGAGASSVPSPALPGGTEVAKASTIARAAGAGPAAEGATGEPMPGARKENVGKMRGAAQDNKRNL